jgi:ubiquinone/menaquinone biosynthesis C-methylase UbiE
MAKQDEAEYFSRIGDHGRAFAAQKPYSDPNCGTAFLDFGMLFSILPPPPGRVLDLGVGTGWTSVFLASRGYDVVGQDISAEGITLAEQNKERAGLKNLSFIVSDYEHTTFANEFDVAVFYDCLHHSEDTAKALSSAYRALKPGGTCVTFEPGRGHSTAAGSKEAMRQWGVTEKDMPPRTVVKVAKQVGFRSHDIYLRLMAPIKLPAYASYREHRSNVMTLLRCLPPLATTVTNIVALRK